MPRTTLSLLLSLLVSASFAQQPQGWEAVISASSMAERNRALESAMRTASRDPGGIARIVAAEDDFLAARGSDATIHWWRIEALLKLRKLSQAAAANRALLAMDPAAPALLAQSGDIAVRAFDTRSAHGAWVRAGDLRQDQTANLAAHRAALDAVRFRQWTWLCGGLVVLLCSGALLWRRSAPSA